MSKMSETENGRERCDVQHDLMSRPVPVLVAELGAMEWPELTMTAVAWFGPEAGQTVAAAFEQAAETDRELLRLLDNLVRRAEACRSMVEGGKHLDPFGEVAHQAAHIDAVIARREAEYRQINVLVSLARRVQS